MQKSFQSSFVRDDVIKNSQEKNFMPIMNFRVPKKIPVERSSLSIRVESITVRDKVGTH